MCVCVSECVCVCVYSGLPGAQMVKNLPACRSSGFDPWVRKIPWRRKGLPTPVFLPGEFHGQRSLVGYSPQVCKGLDTVELLSSRAYIYSLSYYNIQLLVIIMIRCEFYCHKFDYL